MNSKIAIFLLGLSVGAAVCAGVLIKRASSQSPPTTSTATEAIHRQIAELETELASAQAKLQNASADNARLMARVAELERQREEVPDKTEPGEQMPRDIFAALFGGGGTNEMSSAMTDMIKAGAEREVEGQMLGLKARLNLSPEQESAIRDLLKRQVNQGLELAERMMKGELSLDDVASINPEASDHDAQIKALLNPEQAAAYDAFQSEQKTRMARLEANTELLEMQSTLHLNDEQQDQVFAILFEQATRTAASEETATAGWMSETGRERERKVEALSAVLTPEQTELYRKHLEQQAKLIEAFMPELHTNGTMVLPGGSLHVTPVFPK